MEVMLCHWEARPFPCEHQDTRKWWGGLPPGRDLAASAVFGLHPRLPSESLFKKGKSKFGV